MRRELKNRHVRKENKYKEKSTCKEVNKLVIYLNVVRQKQKKLEQDEKNKSKKFLTKK